MNSQDIAVRILYDNQSVDSKPAVVLGANSVSYGELRSIAENTAKLLSKRGFDQNSRILLLADKSGYSVAIAIGIMLSGSTYVPVDKNVSESRLSYILDSCKPKLVIGDAHRLSAREACFNESVETYSIEHVLDSFKNPGWSAADVKSDKWSNRAVSAKSIAYCIYTSGSTGNPKGVSISQGNVNSFYTAFDEVMKISDSSVCLNTSEFHFDVSIMDLFYPLYKGATVLVSSEKNTARKMLDQIEKHKVTHFTAVASLLTMMVTSKYFSSADISSVKRIMTGAEIVNKSTVLKWLESNHETVVVNGYGPTETTVICSYYPIDSSNVNDYAALPIGIPLSGCVLDILVGSDISTESGIEGELLVSGPQVMPGYINNPAATASSNLESGGNIYYRTGDICKKDNSGIFHYLGRVDHEVKISGFRVHLSEIKRVVESLDCVDDAIVCTKSDANGDNAIIAAVVFSDT